MGATPDAVVLLDGVTVAAGTQTGCIHGTSWFSRQLGIGLLVVLAAAPTTALDDALASAIREVADRHAGTCDLEHQRSPSATVAMVRERADAVDYLVLSDSTIVLDSTQGVEVITDHRIARVDAALDEPDLQGRSWVASSDPEVASRALTGTVARMSLYRAAMLSDGASRLVDRFNLVDWQGLLEMLSSEDPEGLIRRVRAAERSDSDGQTWPRHKRHDDASIVFCRFESP